MLNFYSLKWFESTRSIFYAPCGVALLAEGDMCMNRKRN